MGDLGKIPNYQVKVDNWSIFFLQRLHHFYKKDYHCDLTLVFSTFNAVRSIKVHRLVLHACTDYFETMEVTADSEFGECLRLPDEMHSDVVIPIISFMYTGKLEFPASLQSRLYEAATKLRMTILTKLLDAQPKQPIHTGGVQTEEVSSRPARYQCNVSDINTIDTGQCPDSITPAVQVMPISPNSSATPATKQVEDPVVTLTPIAGFNMQSKGSMKVDTSVSRITSFDALKASTLATPSKIKALKRDSSATLIETASKIKSADLSLPPTLPGRKLPIWKRKVPFTGSHVVAEGAAEMRGADRNLLEAPKPTRFEWDEDLNDPTILRPVEDAFRALAHDVETEVLHPIILDGDAKSSDKESNNSSEPRRAGSPGSPDSPDSPPYKRAKQADLQDMKEYGKQQQLRNEILCSEENSEDGIDPDDLYASCDDESQDLSDSAQSSFNSSAPKPILKSLSKPEPSQPLSKRVRFSLEGKENNKKPNDFSALAKKPGAVLTKQKIVLPMNVNQIRTGGHHVKIVSEVLKKYPNLTKRDNVKLKVVSKIPAAVPPTVHAAVEGDAHSGSKSSASHVSYIYLMNENPNQVSNIQIVSNEKEKEFDAENRTGPWICNSCDPSNPIHFDSYFNYRKHLVEVHELKIDARICEYCGLRSSKRNHLLYHLYTKHGIDPPANVSFPRCPECDYIALSDALLLKHKSVHEIKELLTCYVCNVAFRSFSSMQIHLQSSWHKKKVADGPVIGTSYPCPFCDSQFASGVHLKNHIEQNHQSQRATERGGKQIYRCPYCETLFPDRDQLGTHIVSTHWGKGSHSSGQGATEIVSELSGQELQYNEESMESVRLENSECGEQQESSELESLSTVAAGTVTSLNLIGNEQTVVYYEQQAGHQDIGREATVMTGEECKDFIIPDSVEDVQPGVEYQTIEQSDDAVSVENEDSNSRTSNVEVNPISCSDHDYSEPQSEESIRQVIPVQQVSDDFQNASIIQQILPEQQLVFTTGQQNVMFQSSRLNLPQRVLLAPGNVVLSQISHSAQNVILPQVIPQTRIILSNQIIQQPTNIIQDSGSTIVFANADAVQQQQEIEAVESISFVENPPSEEIKEIESKAEEEEEEGGEAEEEAEVVEAAAAAEAAAEEETVVVQDGPAEEETNGDADAANEEEGCNEGESHAPPLTLKQLLDETSQKGEEESSSILSNRGKQKPVMMRGEKAKIVDDWDETNESSQNVESRSDGPSRPDFF